MNTQAFQRSNCQAFIASGLQVRGYASGGEPCVGLIEIVNRLEKWIGYDPLTIIDYTSPCHLKVFMDGSSTAVSMLVAINRIRRYFNLPEWPDLEHGNCQDYCEHYKKGIGTLRRSDYLFDGFQKTGSKTDVVDYPYPFPGNQSFIYELVHYGYADEQYKCGVSPYPPTNYYYKNSSAEIAWSGKCKRGSKPTFNPSSDPEQSNEKILAIGMAGGRSLSWNYFTLSRHHLDYFGFILGPPEVIEPTKIKLGFIEIEGSAQQMMEKEIAYIVGEEEFAAPAANGQQNWATPRTTLWGDVSTPYRAATKEWLLTSGLSQDPDCLSSWDTMWNKYIEKVLTTGSTRFQALLFSYGIVHRYQDYLSDKFTSIWRPWETP